MSEVQEQASVAEYVARKISDGIGRLTIEQELVAKGMDERFVKELVQETFKLHYTKRRTKGLTLVLIGAIICFVSFLLSVTSSSLGGNFSFFLYGLTSVGIIVVFAGFTMIF